MRTARPMMGMMAGPILILFLMMISTEAMARGGGPGGGGGGGGYGGGRGGGIRSAPPGNYRMRRAYDSYTRPARESGVPPRTGSQATDSPSRATSPRSNQPASRIDQPASRTGRNPSLSPERGPMQYRDITEKYERLREARHQEYWEQRQSRP